MSSVQVSSDHASVTSTDPIEQENRDEGGWKSERNALKRKADQAEEECERLRGEVKRRRMENEDVRRFVRGIMDEEGLSGSGVGVGSGLHGKTGKGTRGGQKQVTARSMKRIMSGSENGEVVEIDVEDEVVHDDLEGDVAMEDGEVDEQDNNADGNIMREF